MKNNYQIRSHFCTCHDSWAAVACANLWPSWKIRIDIRTKWMIYVIRLWTHEPFVRCIPEPIWTSISWVDGQDGWARLATIQHIACRPSKRRLASWEIGSKFISSQAHISWGLQSNQCGFNTSLIKAIIETQVYVVFRSLLLMIE